MPSLNLTVLPETFAVCRLEPNMPLPNQIMTAPFWSVTRTTEELSLVVPESFAPAEATIETGWRALKVAGPLDFALVGILAALTQPLAEAGISIFAISTYDTDYLLVKITELERTVTVLRAQGHKISVV
ncbi:ACT domain-containing protein [Anaerolineales bacterium HSG6]|nr:ACT domain-containing protein [Anaerolineales bacterium HSG6]